MPDAKAHICKKSFYLQQDKYEELKFGISILPLLEKFLTDNGSLFQQRTSPNSNLRNLCQFASSSPAARIALRVWVAIKSLIPLLFKSKFDPERCRARAAQQDAVSGGIYQEGSIRKP